MQRFRPIIKLHAMHQDQDIYINAFVLVHQGNHYHLQGSTGDTIHAFAEGVAIYAISINRDRSSISLSCFMAPEPDPINCLYLHNQREIREYLGPKWEGMKPIAMIRGLIEHLY